MTEPRTPEQTKSVLQLAQEEQAFAGTPVGGRSFAVEGNDTSGYLGVDPEYRTYANETERPGVTPVEAEVFYPAEGSVSVNPSATGEDGEVDYGVREAVESDSTEVQSEEDAAKAAVKEEQSEPSEREAKDANKLQPPL